jgi:CubicO group peptidase (beta-lactamase class C family)
VLHSREKPALNLTKVNSTFHYCCTALLLSFSLSAWSAPLEETAVAAIPGALQKRADQGELAGAVTLVALDGKIVELDAVGYADISSEEAMATDSMFWVASMTKPITAASVLLLVDEGRIGLDDPVEKYLPELQDIKMISGTDNGSKEPVRPGRSITIRDLLRHTHGLPDIPQPAAGTSLAQVTEIIARGPLQFEPGSQWKYGNAGMSVLGRVVEVVSGKAFPDFFQERLFGPLGMKNTTFFPNAEQRKRLARSYKFSRDEKKLSEAAITSLNGDLALGTQTISPGGGLFSTAEDMFCFYQMLLNGGTFAGRRYLSADTVHEMLSPQTGSLKTGFSAGMSWGLGLGIVTQPQEWTECLAAGTWGHDGAYGTSVMADPSRKLLFIMMIQCAGLNPFTDGLRFRRDFHGAVMSAFSH